MTPQCDQIDPFPPAQHIWSHIFGKLRPVNRGITSRLQSAIMVSTIICRHTKIQPPTFTRAEKHYHEIWPARYMIGSSISCAFGEVASVIAISNSNMDNNQRGLIEGGAQHSQPVNSHLTTHIIIKMVWTVMVWWWCWWWMMIKMISISSDPDDNDEKVLQERFLAPQERRGDAQSQGVECHGGKIQGCSRFRWRGRVIFVIIIIKITIIIIINIIATINTINIEKFRSYAQNVVFDVWKKRTKLPTLGGWRGG